MDLTTGRGEAARAMAEHFTHTDSKVGLTAMLADATIDRLLAAPPPSSDGARAEPPAAPPCATTIE